MYQSNKGMYLETIINRSLMYYINNDIAYISKRNLPIHIKAITDQYKVSGYLKQKSQADYYGLYNGYYFDFEAKQCVGHNFPLSSLKKHQYEHLLKVDLLSGIAFLIIYFVEFDEFYFVNIGKIKMLLNAEHKQHIDYEWFKSNALKLTIIFPGILNIIDPIKKIINLYD